MSYLAYKPQVRQDGFHMAHQNGPPSPANMDPASMFMLPDAFRKFGQAANDFHAHPGLDFSDDLAQLMAGPNAQSMQMQPHTPGAYDDAYRHTTHNIFDISAPLSASHHPALSSNNSHNGLHHHQQQHQQQHQQHAQSAPGPSHYPSSFTLNPRHNEMGLISPPGSLQQQQGAGPLAEFNKPPSMFNSTLPALNSSMRFEPPAPAPHDPTQAAFQLPPDFRQRHTPSPVTNLNGVSRSRSRSRAPSTGPGPMRTQPTTRAKRNSISSASPPRQHPSAILIPGANGSIRGASRDIAHSPLSLNTASGWFAPEFGLPTPDSVTSHAGAFGLPGRDSSLGPVVDEPSPSASGMSDVAAKQAALANEKRRRRRESHNAVERRRRDNINEKIGELATLIPECMLDPNAPANFVPTEDQITGVAPMPVVAPKAEEPIDAPSTPTGPGSAADALDTAANKANKGMILRKSVDYIRYLQQLVTAQASRNRTLESELAGYRGGVAPDSGAADDNLRDLVLHDGFADFGAFAFDPATFAGGALPAVHEMDTEEDGDRPMTGVSSARSGEGASPSIDGDSDEYEPEERGRRGRDGRMGGVDLDVPGVRVKTEGPE